MGDLRLMRYACVECGRSYPYPFEAQFCRHGMENAMDKSKLLAWLEHEAMHFESRALETSLDTRMLPLDRIVTEHSFRVRAMVMNSVRAEVEAGTFNLAPHR